MPHVPHIARGTGPAVLLVHGLAGFKESWGPLPDAIARGGGRALALDLPGFGAAPAPRRPATTDLYAEGLVPVASALAPVAIVGHSLGAQVALRLAALLPDAVSAVALIAPVVVPRRPAIPRTMVGAVSLPVAGPALARAAIVAARRDPGRRRRAILSAAGDPDRLRPGSPEAALVDEAAARLGRQDAGAFATWASTALRRGALADAALCRPPALVVAGARDRLAPPGDMDRLMAILPDGRFLGGPRIGHFPHLEQADEVVAAVSAHVVPAPAAAA